MVSPVRFRPSAPNPARGSLWSGRKLQRTPGEQVVIRHPERLGESLELSGAKRIRGHPEGGVAVFANERTSMATAAREDDLEAVQLIPPAGSTPGEATDSPPFCVDPEGPAEHSVDTYPTDANPDESRHGAAEK